MKSFKTVFLILVALLFAQLTTSCGSDSAKGDEGASCTKTADCKKGLKCIGKVCVGDDGDTGNTGDDDDTVNSGDDGDTGNTDDNGDTADSGDDGNTGDSSDSGNTANSGNDSDVTPPFCGDGNIDEGEICDGNTITCSKLGLGVSDAVVQCNESCDGWLSANVCKKTQNCLPKPENSEWVTQGDYEQVWDGEKWESAENVTTQTSKGNVKPCQFKCNENLVSWDNSTCKSMFKQWGTSEKDEARAIAVDKDGNIYAAGFTLGSLDGNQFGESDAFLTKFNSDGTEAWTKQWGTDKVDEAKSVVVDDDGNIYVAGSTFGAFQDFQNAGYGTDLFLTKFNSSGEILWTEQWGTEKYDGSYSLSMALDNNGNLYISGDTSGSFEGFTNLSSGDVFITKFKLNGSKEWTKQWGTDRQDRFGSMAVDNEGNIFVTGYSDGVFEGFSNIGHTDSFLIKLDSEGEITWIQMWGTDKEDRAKSVAVDKTGFIYVAGVTAGDFEGFTSIGSYDSFLSQFNSEGSLIWTKQWGTESGDYAGSAAVDDEGNVYVTGDTGGSFEGFLNKGTYDIFLSKWNSDGSYGWTKQWGTEALDEPYGITIDSFNYIYIAGITGGAWEGNSSVGGWDAFIIKFVNNQ